MGSVASKLRIYESGIQGLMQTHISAVETLVENLKDDNKKLREWCLPLLQWKPEPLKSEPDVLQTERAGMPHKLTGDFLLNHGEDMRQWDRKLTCVLEAGPQELREKGKVKSVRVSAMLVSLGQGSDPLEGTSHMYSQEPILEGSGL